MTKIDVKDRKILSELDMDARMPITKLAKKVGLSRQVVEYRIKRMQKENIIHGTKGIFDSVVAGFNWYRVVLRLLHVTKEEKEDFLTFLKTHKNTLWLGEVGGNWDLVVNFVCKDHFAFNKIFEEIVSLYGRYIHDSEVLIYVDVHDYERSYILKKKELTIKKGERKEFFHQMIFNPLIKIDKLSQKLIGTLAQNSLPSNLEVGKKLNVTGNTITNRIKQMQKEKLLLGFRLFINPSVLGYQSHMLLLETTRLDLGVEKKLNAYLKSIPQVIFVVKHIGKWRIGIEIETKNQQEFQDIFVDLRGKFSEIITNFESFPIFKDYAINYSPEGVLNKKIKK